MSGVDIATLALRVDSSEVAKARSELAMLAQQGGVTQQAVGQLAAASSTAAKSESALAAALASTAASAAAATSETNAAANAASNLARATDSQGAAIKAAAAANENLTGSARRTSAAYNDMAEAIGRREAAERSSAQASMRSAAATNEATAANARQAASMQAMDAHVVAHMRHLEALPGIHGKGAAGAKLQAHELLNLSRQLADVGVTAAMGMNPLMIAVQQGPQIGEIFQTAATRGMKASAVFGEIGQMVGKVLGTAGPFALGAAVVGTLGAAFLQGNADAAAFANALQITGNYAALTAGEFERMAVSIDRAANTGFGNAQKAIMAVAATGKFTGDEVGALSDVVARLADLTGKSADEFAGAFAGMGSDVSAFALKFNDQYHVLSTAQLEHIRLLQAEGETAKAQMALILAVQQELADRGPKQLGYLEAAWRGVGNAIEWAWNRLKAFGNEGAQLPGQIEAAQRRAASAQQASAASPNNPSLRAAAMAAQGAVDALKKVEAAQAGVAKAGAESKRVTQEGAEAQARMNGQWAAGQDSAGRYQAKLKEYDADLRRLSEAGLALPSAAKQAAARAAIYAETMPKAVAAAKKLESAQDSLAAAEARRAEALAREMAATAATADANLDLARAYGQGGLAALEAQSRVEAVGKAIKAKGDIEAFVAAQLDLNAAKAAAAAAKTAFDLGEQSKAQQLANAAVAAGTMTQAEANEQVKLAGVLRPIEIAMTKADAETKAVLVKVMEDLKKATGTYNDTVRDGQLLAANGAQRDQLEVLRAEASLIGATNAQRARELAMIEARQALERQKKGSSESVEGRKNVQGAGDLAALAEDNAAANDNYNASLTKTLDLLTAMESRASSAASGMASSFGSFGAAVGNLNALLITSQRTQEQIRVKREADVKAASVSSAASAYEQIKSAERIRDINAAASDEMRSERVRSYGDMTSAAKGFFKEGSGGYKVMEAAERGFRLFEFAMSAKAIAVKAVEAGAKIGLYGAESAAGVTAGAAAIFAALGPFAFPVIGAMIATMAGLGFKGGGGGGASAPSRQSRQDAQGAGSVFGDSSAKSESLTRAMEIASANQNKDLEYSSQMVRSLRAIESNIGVVASSLIRQLGVGGGLSGEGLGLGTTRGGPGALGTGMSFGLSMLFPSLFGTKTTRTLTDAGLTFDPQSLGDILGGGLDGQTYQDIETKKKKKFFGVTYSNTSRTSTVNGELEAGLSDEIGRVLASLKEGVLAAAGAIGITGAEATLNALNIALGDISLKDLNGQEITEALNAVFGKVGDDMAAAVLGDVAKFQKAGEGAFETLVRVARGYEVVNTTLASIGKTFSGVGAASVAARQRLVDLVGGLDNLTDLTSSYAESFLTDQERLSPVQAAVTAEMKRLGLSSIVTKGQFKAVVDQIDVSTEAGAKLYAALLQVAPAFAKVAEAATGGAQKALETANDNLARDRDAVIDAYNRESGALRDTESRFRAFGDSLRKFRASLDTGPLSGLSPEDRYFASKSAFENARARAAAGDETALGELQSVSEAYLNASRDYYASSEGYFADLAAVKSAVQAAAGTSDRTADIAGEQLKTMESQLTALGLINTSILSLGSALSAYASSVAAQKQADADARAVNPPPTASGGTAPVVLTPEAQAVVNGTLPPPTPTVTAPMTEAERAAAYLANNPDVAASINGGWLGGVAAEYGMNAEQAAVYHFQTYGQGEGRAFAKGGAFGPGGIITRPTAFMTGQGAGVAGEAGWEGALPLTNVGGKLGVHASGQNDNARLERKLDQVLQAIEHGNVQRSEAVSLQVDELKKVGRGVRDVRRGIQKQAAK